MNSDEMREKFLSDPDGAGRTLLAEARGWTMGVCGADDRDDRSQEVIVRTLAWLRPERRVPVPLHALVGGIARNVGREYWRERHRRRDLAERLAPGAARPADMDPLQGLVLQEETGIALEAVGRLPREEAAVLRLRALGQSEEARATLLGKSRRTVEEEPRRGRRAIRLAARRPGRPRGTEGPALNFPVGDGGLNRH